MYMKDGDIADYLESVAQVLRNLTRGTPTIEHIRREVTGVAMSLDELATDMREG